MRALSPDTFPRCLRRARALFPVSGFRLELGVQAAFAGNSAEWVSAEGKTSYRRNGSRVQGSGFRVQGSGFRVQGLGCKMSSYSRELGAKVLLRHLLQLRELESIHGHQPREQLRRGHLQLFPVKKTCCRFFLRGGAQVTSHGSSCAEHTSNSFP